MWHGVVSDRWLAQPQGRIESSRPHGEAPTPHTREAAPLDAACCSAALHPTVAACVVSLNTVDSRGVFAAVSSGAGLTNLPSGTAALFDCSVLNNTMESFKGGVAGVYNRWTMWLVRCLVSGNIGTNEASGGLQNGVGGEVTVEQTVVSHNEGWNGGGVSNGEIGLVLDLACESLRVGAGCRLVMRLFGCLVTHNSARNNAGGVLNYGLLNLTGSAVNLNAAINDGGGLVNSRANPQLCGRLEMYLGVILNNSAGRGGGGLVNSPQVPVPPCQVVLGGVDVQYNTATRGAGIHNTWNYGGELGAPRLPPTHNLAPHTLTRCYHLVSFALAAP